MTDYRTPEQAAADEALEEALRQVAEAYGEHPGDGPLMVNDYVTIVCTQRVDSPGKVGYGIFHAGQRYGGYPEHYAEGLLRRGLRLLYEDDDD